VDELRECSAVGIPGHVAIELHCDPRVLNEETVMSIVLCKFDKGFLLPRFIKMVNYSIDYSVDTS
jgi:hypothetical protein